MSISLFCQHHHLRVPTLPRAQPSNCLAQEELQRRRERAARFQTEDKLAEYQPAVDKEQEERRRARAKKFGVAYAPRDETGLADAGALRTCVLAPPSDRPSGHITCQNVQPTSLSQLHRLCLNGTNRQPQRWPACHLTRRSLRM